MYMCMCFLLEATQTTQRFIGDGLSDFTLRVPTRLQTLCYKYTDILFLEKSTGLPFLTTTHPLTLNLS